VREVKEETGVDAGECTLHGSSSLGLIKEKHIDSPPEKVKW